ncbi:transcriptional regulator [Cupriavidus pauculus]|uniref:Transcriptional regulator n=1 Tax=Cupriavidus pauculus TaxID=82633 RepID=A0A5P2H9A2_9BURK|nr:winged helix-turn-helix domain-containing protein [Cupriavidus pauculus]QET04278.1 transcriptional regulator [Cupriavidus pauculus]
MTEAQTTPPEGSANADGNGFGFGRFRLIPGRQLLLDGETPVRIGGRALEILAALVERPGDLVSKAELMARAWPNTVVEDSNLKVHMAALRRALGDGQPGQRYIATVIGRGYRFVAPVSSTTSSLQPAELASPPHNLPALTTRVIGRGDAIDTLLSQLRERRFVTVVGPGGIGKTTVALAVADAVIAGSAREVPSEVRFVDLAPLSDSHFVGGTIAAALGLSVQGSDALPAVVACLRERPMLIVLDSCEHVIDAAAAFAEQIVSGAPDVRILATSRESLRVRGEVIYRLAPLDLPPDSATLTAREALASPAVQLFVERAAECVDGFELRDADAPVVAEICRKLDGIALAIELAATRLDAFSIHDLSILLEDRLRLLYQDRRGTLPRHRTLAAALDWSYEYLPVREQTLLRRLSVCIGPFTRETAAALGALDGEPPEVVEAMANLVAKSLLVADVTGHFVYYRLLDTTRAYGQHKLIALGEYAHCVRRHAEHHRDLLTRAAAEWEARPTAAWLADYGGKIDDVRAALRWAFSPAGDVELGISLTVAAIPLWMHLALFEECRQAVEGALAVAAERASDGTQDRRDEMKLNAALGAALLYAQGPTVQTGRVWSRALALAEQLSDGEYQLRALWGLSVYHTYIGEHRIALDLAARFREVAAGQGDRAAQLSIDRMSATALRYLGEQDQARRYLDRMLGQYVSPVHRSHIARFQLDQRAAALGTLSSVQWLQGFPDQAMASAHRALDDARGTHHALSVSNALVNAVCPIALLVGDIETARHAHAMLAQHLARQPVTFWNALSTVVDGMLRLRQHDFTGICVMRGGLDALESSGFRLRYPAYLGVLADGMGAAGQFTEAHAAIDEALSWSARTGERWCLPELLRIKGGLIREGDGDLEAAAAHLRQAVDLARHQRALSWELRAAFDLAKLLAARNRAAEALALLAPVQAKFTEGFRTADYLAARALLATMHLHHV